MLRRHIMLMLAAAVTGCATIQEIAALRSVRFQLDRVTEPRLAGVDLSRAQSAADLSFREGAAVASAFASRRLPLSFRLHLRAENPASNEVTARLLRMRWTLYLEDTETVSGRIDREYVLSPGRPADIPIDVSLDLLEFYERSGADLIELALNVAGAGGQPKHVKVTATPTIDTPLGAITYPQPITIVAGSVGRPEVGPTEAPSSSHRAALATTQSRSPCASMAALRPTS